MIIGRLSEVRGRSESAFSMAFFYDSAMRPNSSLMPYNDVIETHRTMEWWHVQLSPFWQLATVTRPGLSKKMKCSSGPGCQNDEMLHLWLPNPERNNSGGISSSLGRFPLCHYRRIKLEVFRYRSLLYLSEVIKWKTPLGQSEG